MLIRHQGNLIKVLRVEPPTQPPTRGRRREHVLSTFRADEPIPPELLDALSRDERKSLERWLAVYQEGLARTDARRVVATAPAQLESLVSALEVAADTLSAADADHLWTQLQAIARTLKRAGHPRPRAARRPPAPLPGQQDFFGEYDELEQLGEQ
ncbi:MULTISPECIES: hypothetical protein [Burkholderia cepacia complex]|uniref:Uncharacterized protein n=2 Tax=Burkholderia cepacia complex TaxID=87882 RepID=A0AAP1V791_9BURK|nr:MULTISPECIES: hypothetical protein [Burkholderia cepacia complex]MBK1902225.1 hypothetical protein [Burkholderia contaminans]MBK1910508.1 hypothetical protein [Burkholderia contaminans]MBK1923967.1 hypothetical protein [Burkholderia contaminans]MBK1932179.1 hypothetical protein [Burkholderia contaminans]MBK1939428.1 hypothetical protein [Burkholderia contaminans]